MAVFGGNPNGRNPFQTPDFTKSKQLNGSANPYGYGAEQVFGQLAPQFNQTGMGGATNSSPFPTATQPRGFDPAQYRVQTPWAHSPAVAYAFQQSGSPLSFDQWMMEMLTNGQMTLNGGALGMTPAYYSQSQGWIPLANGGLYNTTTSASAPQTEAQYAALRMGMTGATRFDGQDKTYVSGWGASPSHTPMTPRGHLASAGTPQPTTPATPAPASAKRGRVTYGY